MNAKRSPQKPYLLFLLASVFTGMLIFVTIFLDQETLKFLRIIGAVSGIGSLFFFIPPFVLLKKYGGVNEDQTFLETTQVVSEGIYSLIRHPQYFGYILMVLCFMLLSQHLAAICFGSAAIILFYLHMIQEENHCLETLGEEYHQYITEVPRINLILGIYRTIRKKIKIDLENEN